MEIRFQNEIEDVTAFWEYYVQTTPTLKKAQYRVPLFLSLVCGFVAASLLTWILQLQLGVAERREHILIFFALALGLSLLNFPFIRSEYRKEIQRYRSRLASECTSKEDLGTQAMKLSPAGISVVTELSSENVSWQTIDQIVETEKHIFFLRGKNKAHVIPKRSFSDLAKMTQFLEFARQCKQQSSS